MKDDHIYKPVPWPWGRGFPPPYTNWRLEDVPSEFRYSDCECGERWVDHLPERRGKAEAAEIEPSAMPITSR
jgi:hypothetical protein